MKLIKFTVHLIKIVNNSATPKTLHFIKHKRGCEMCQIKIIIFLFKIGHDEYKPSSYFYADSINVNII